MALYPLCMYGMYVCTGMCLQYCLCASNTKFKFEVFRTSGRVRKTPFLRQKRFLKPNFTLVGYALLEIYPLIRLLVFFS